MGTWDNVTIVENEDAFWRAALMMTRGDPDPDATAEGTYFPFQDMIEAVLVRHQVRRDDYFLQDDWWPILTRCVYIYEAAMSKAIMSEWIALFAGRFADWRIEIYVDKSKSDKTPVAHYSVDREQAVCMGDWQRFVPDQGR